MSSIRINQLNGPSILSRTGKLFAVALLAAGLSAGMVAPSQTLAMAEASSSQYKLKKSGGKKKTVSHRKMRSGGHGSSSAGLVSGRQIGSHNYIKRRSLADGRYHRSGKIHKRYLHEGRGSVRYSAGTARSGVALSSGGPQYHRHSGKHYSHRSSSDAGMREVRIERRVLRSSADHGHRHATGFSASGLIVIETAPTGGMVPVAGGVDDCSYGSYCTIDLGGPKIITFNDVGDFNDDVIPDDEMSEEEYLKKYGGK